MKQAAELLGVPEQATLEEIEKRYYLVVRRQRNNPEDYPNFEEISQAYKKLKDYHVNKMMENNEVYQAEMKKSPTRRKIEHFLSSYKLHIFGSIVALFFIIMMIQAVLDNAAKVPGDANVMLFGSYYAETDAEPIEQRMTALVPEWQRVAVQLVFIPNEDTDQFDVGMMQKAMVMLATERPDIYVVDTKQFQQIGNQGAFQPIDDYEEKLRGLFGEERLVYHQFTEDTERHLYGIDLTDHAVFEGLMMDQNLKIFTVRGTLENPANALRLLEALANPPDNSTARLHSFAS